MLRLRNLIIVFSLCTLFVFIFSRGNTETSLRRITTTSEETINLNPSLSGDGRYITFESTGDLANTGSPQSFHALLSTVDTDPANLSEIGQTRLITAGVSQDSSKIAFSSMEDLVDHNHDRNSEIFVREKGQLRQVTNTSSDSAFTRTIDGCFQPSITDDGRFIAFSSNRDLAGLNSDLNFEIFLYDANAETISQITNTNGIANSDAKISGDGSHVVFSRQNDLTTTNRDLILYDRASGVSNVIALNAESLALTPGRAISDSGSRVVYSLETGEHRSQIFLYDLAINRSRQITDLATRVTEVPLNPTISGDGKRIAFASRRRVVGSSDGSVELYVYDIPTAKFSQITQAPVSAVAALVSSMNDTGSIVAFNFPRVLSGGVTSSEVANNCEIYIASLPERPAFSAVTVLNRASMGHEEESTLLPRGGIATAQGDALAIETIYGSRSTAGSFPLSVAGSTVTVNSLKAQILYASPSEIHFMIPDEVSSGPAEVIVTNSDGFESHSSVIIADTAPGIFTTSGNGLGEAITLNSESFVAGPFDPTTGSLRLTLFATGVRHATDTAVEIAGRNVAIETVQPSDLPGLDEIHLLVPANLRGAGEVTISIEADGRKSNLATVALAGNSLREIVINEILVDPPDGSEGDANHDGTRSASNDEFVELVNSTTRDLDLSGFLLQTRGLGGSTDVIRHRFPPGSIFPAGTAIVIFGGGNPNFLDPVFGGARVFKASSGSLSLANTGGVVTVSDSLGSAVSFTTYGSGVGLPGDANQSLTRSPDIVGSYVLHMLAPDGSGRSFSPGTHINGAPFKASPAIARIEIAPSFANLLRGQQQQFTARAFSQNGDELSNVLFHWESSNAAIATVDLFGLAKAVAPGTCQVVATARDIESPPAQVDVTAPSTPTPSPSPSPSSSATPTPTPSPSPGNVPPILISEFRTRGPNGASDEFIELYNNSNAPIEIGGWKLKGSSSNGTITTRATVNTGTLIPARGHFLFVNSSAYSGLVTGNQTFSSGIADDGGIAVTTSADGIVDQVGMSPGSAFKEGSVLSPQSGTLNQSYERRPGSNLGSSQDTGDNSADFRQLSPSEPQNLSSAPTPGPSPSPSPSSSPTPAPTPSATPSPSPTPTQTPVPVTQIVISQIYGGGGNAGAPFRNDFIEIFNRGPVAVDLTGWSVQYSSATSNSWSVTNLAPRSIAPGQYYLIQEATGGVNGQPLPSPDASGSINLASTAGKVALVNSLAPLSSACPATSALIDLVGYGSSASCFETAAAVAPGNTVALLRSGDGCIDSENNEADFSTSAPTPRNTTAVMHNCTATVSRNKDVFSWFSRALLKSLLFPWLGIV